jgi:long-chain acyl-CoA synthetase
VGADVAGHASLAAATNLADLLASTAARRGAAEALVQRTGPARVAISWTRLDSDVSAAAAGFRVALKLHPGHRVALVMGNTPAFVTAYFALLRAGLVAVPLNTAYPSSELALLLAESRATVVLCDEANEHTVEEAVAESDRVLVGDAGLDSVISAGREVAPLAPSAGGEALAVLLFTSGGGGRPQAAMLSHRALLANLRQCLALDPPPMREDDVVLLVLPLFNVHGLNAGLGLVAATGARAVIAERFEPRGTLELIRDEGVTNVPVAMRGVRLLDDDDGDLLLVDRIRELALVSGLNIHPGEIEDA